MARCFWCSDDPLYMAYHDQEWGVPLRDAHGLFELLLLEGFQAGLSWITVLKKREHYRQVMFGFDAQRLAVMSDAEIEALLQDPGIIRNRLKVAGARRNAQAWLALDNPVAFLWSFVQGTPKINHFTERHEFPAVTPEAEAMSKGLKKPGSRSSGRPFAMPLCKPVAWSWTTPPPATATRSWQTAVRMLATLEPCGRRLVLGQRQQTLFLY